MELIDRVELKNIVKLDDYGITWDSNTIIKLLEEAPTIDAVPVVRCKDCKYLGDEIQDDYGGKYRLCKEHGGQVRLEDFCSWAEEREE